MKIKNVETGACPLIVHAPSWTCYMQAMKNPAGFYKVNPLWRPILNKWRRTKIEKTTCSESKDLTIITWNNSDQKGIMEKSLDRLGIPYIHLGKGLKEWRISKK